MMTTASPSRRTPPLVLAAVSAGLLGVALAGAGALTQGTAAAYGALVGTLVAVGVFAFGAFAVDAVARLMPVASLLVAMVTYTFQVVVMALVFVAVNRAGLLESTLDREWLGGAIILGALTWSFVQVWATSSARIPAFEDPAARPGDDAVEAPAHAAEGGAR
jgi:hypothetical protein